MWCEDSTDKDMEETLELVDELGEWSAETCERFNVQQVTITSANEDSTFDVKKISDGDLLESVTRKQLFAKFW